MVNHATLFDRRDQSSAVRRLKLLVGVLVFSNLALGVFSIFLLRAVDARYSELIDSSVPLLNDLQTLTAKSVEAMRSTNPVLHEPVAQREAALKRGGTTFETDRVLRTKILGAQWAEAAGENRATLQVAGADFTRLGGQVLELYAAGRPVDAARLRETELRPVFDRYLDVTTKAADVVEETSLRTNSSYSKTTDRFTKMILGFAGWPMLVVGVLLLFSAGSLVVLVLAFRERPISESS